MTLGGGDGEQGDEAEPGFDFDAHEAVAVGAYRKVRGLYEDYAATVQALLTSALVTAGVKPHSVEHRAKTEASFGLKAARPDEADPETPKYSDPLVQIQDLAGCRVITYFLEDVQAVQAVIESEFSVIERVNRSSYLRAGGRPGYESYHYIVDLGETRQTLSEYARYEGRVVEIQVRTILQHAWAEIEHDIQYRSVDALPKEIGQRFMELAGMIAISDREFQAISDAHQAVREAADESFKEGHLADVELTPETLKRYIDDAFGADGRMRDWSYSWTTRLLKRLGFSNLEQLADCIKDYDDDRVSRLVWGSRQGQLTRLELVVMTSMGQENWIAAHPWAGGENGEAFRDGVEARFARLKAAGIEAGHFSPSAAGASTSGDGEK